MMSNIFATYGFPEFVFDKFDSADDAVSALLDDAVDCIIVDNSIANTIVSSNMLLQI